MRCHICNAILPVPIYDTQRKEFMPCMNCQEEAAAALAEYDVKPEDVMVTYVPYREDETEEEEHD